MHGNISRVIVVGRKWSSKDIHVLIPGICKYITCQRGIEVADGIKIANELTLIQNIILDYAGGHSVITSTLKRGKGGQKSWCLSDTIWERLHQPQLSFKKEVNCETRNASYLQKLEKARKQVLPLSLQSEHSCTDTLILAQ